MVKPIKEVLMERDSMSEEEAESLINNAKNTLDYLLELGDLSGAYNICQDYFGLEPDYLEELVSR